MKGHAEQYVNAKLAEKFGVGVIATEENALDQLLNAYANNKWPSLNQRPERFEFDGAEQAAHVITRSILPRIHLATDELRDQSSLAVAEQL